MCVEEKVRTYDHFLVETRLKVVGGWSSARRMEGVRSVLKVYELNLCERMGIPGEPS